MVWNTPIRETELLHALEEQLRVILPTGWVLSASYDHSESPDQHVDLVLEIEAPSDGRAQILVEAKRYLEPQGVPAALRSFAHRAQVDERVNREKAGLLMAAPYLSPRARDLLAQAGASWFDATGNLRLHLPRPMLFIDRAGASRRPHGEALDRRLQSLKGRAAARVVRTLLDEPGPHRVRALAARAGVGSATGARVLDLLTRDAIVERGVSGVVTTVRKQSLVRRWVEDYGLTTTNSVTPALAPRGLHRLMRDLGSYRGPYAATGSAALRAYLPEEQAAVTPVSMLTLFVTDAVVARRDLHVRRVDRGANVLLVEPFDPVVYKNTTFLDGVRCVSPGQAVADLLTGPGRGSEEAAQLLGVLADTDEEWAE